MRIQQNLAVIVGILGLAVAAPASAEVQWSFSTSGCSGATTINVNGTNHTVYNQCGSSGSPTSAPNVTTTAWSNTKGNSWTGGSSTDASYSNAQTIESAYIGVYSSNPGQLGITNKDYVAHNGETSVDGSEGVSPEHAMDNNQRFDSLLFSFEQAIKLTKIQLGWHSTDSDMTILAYTGTLNADGSLPTSVLTGLTYSQLTSNGWSLIGNYADVASNSYSAKDVNAGEVYSKYWLIGAYNPLGGTSMMTTGNDSVKVKYLFGDYSSSSSSSSSGGQVPAPGSVLLVGLALAAMARARRHQAS